MSSESIPRAAGPGRPRDAALDDVILAAARDLVVESGFDGTTMDAVAERAGTGKATLYRRWGSKTELVADAISRSTPTPVADDIPDTGSLRGDLDEAHRALHRSRDQELVSGLVSEVQRDPVLAKAFHERLVASKTRLLRGLLERARQRGEVPEGHDLELLASIVPAMVMYRKMITGGSVDDDYIRRITSEVLLPLATRPV
ncbi:TetR/AcrR family transcriptional regulator [Paraoerskovia sediminicola]|nr:TetR/AcrR family transcriptional regulator [Paraoerskovia sediminicola]